MKDFKFSNLLGTVYLKGNVLFTPDGFSVISPVGNRITIYDLKKNTSSTLAVESSHNYTAIALSPNGNILIAGNEIGEAHIISLLSRTLIHTQKFDKEILHIKFSPDSKHFAIAKDNEVFIYNAPSAKVAFNPLTMEGVYHSASGLITYIDWSFDSKLIIMGSEDMALRVYAIEKFANFKNRQFTNHSSPIVSCFFDKDSYNIYSLSRDGKLCLWECEETPDKFVLQVERKWQDDDDLEDFVITEPSSKKRHVDESYRYNSDICFKRTRICYYSSNLKKNAKVTVSELYKESKLLVTGFDDGSFYIHEMPYFNLIHSLKISDTHISTININKTGEWLAFGCPKLGQLLVWEWKSETFIMKQQGHFNTMNVFAYSPDGRNIATGGDDGKVKVWDTLTSFCFVTFNEHEKPITGITFAQSGNAILSSSLDGTVRAFDTQRYRNFRTYTSTKSVQFSCVGVDPSGQFVAAGGQDVFEVYLWSMNTGRLLEILSGHEGPVTAVAFSPNLGKTLLVSLSWDKTFRVWETIDKSSNSNRETVNLTSEGTCLAFRGDGNELAIGSIDSQISIFETTNFTQKWSVDGKNDLGAGRSDTDLVSAKQNLKGKTFTSLAYSPDGQYILAAGQSKNLCMYDSSTQILLKKFIVTKNQSFDSITEYINHRKMTEFGNLNLIEDRNDHENDNLRLPGVRKGDMASRSFKPEIRVSCIKFSPTGRAWAASTTEGLLVYSCDTNFIFDPIGADENVTPDSIRTALSAKEHIKALTYSLKLNMKEYITEVVEKTPLDAVQSVCQGLPMTYVSLLLEFLSQHLGETRHLQFYLHWIEKLMTENLQDLKEISSSDTSSFNTLEKNLTKKQQDFVTLVDHNKQMLKYICDKSAQSNNLERKELFKQNITFEVNSVGDSDSEHDGEYELIYIRN